MEDPTKLLDTLIKAPLWFFLALALAASITLLGLPPIVRLGLRPDVQIVGVPMVAFAILFGCLFVASAAARFLTALAKGRVEHKGRSGTLRRYKYLSNEARYLLHSADEQKVEGFALPLNDPVARELRDLKLIDADRVSNTVGIFSTTEYFRIDLIYHRKEVLAILRRPWGDMMSLRERMTAAQELFRTTSIQLY